MVSVHHNSLVVKCFRLLFPCCCGQPTPKSEFSVLFLGLNGAGKSTLLAAAAGEDTNNIQATTGERTNNEGALGGTNDLKFYFQALPLRSS